MTRPVPGPSSWSAVLVVRADERAETVPLRLRAVAAALVAARPALPLPHALVVVDDRPVGADPAPVDGPPADPPPLAPEDLVLPGAAADVPVTTIRTGGRGEAAARNAGLRSATTTWVVELGDGALTTGATDALVTTLAAAVADPGAAVVRPAGSARVVPRAAALAVDGYDERHPDPAGPRGAVPRTVDELLHGRLDPLAADLDARLATGTGWRPAVRAVLFDRDGTLVHDVPYNGDPDQVRVVDGAREVLDALRDAGVLLGIVSNQSGVARGLLTLDQVHAVNARVSAELGPFDTVQVCPHGTGAGCACRKPGPGLVLRAAAALGVAPWECAVVGDIGADVGAAVAAGAQGVLVPTVVTRGREVALAPVVAADLRAAAAHLVPEALPPLRAAG
ncbi:HAD-IIIA family hydrolase [Cellulomonas endophytica]|uniref:D-glycero-alpha-D-manno-heptose-1,7-bisphosphate 7-phosphatase n=1 Tax=Cellulomonas endophytica TaxID=2494735 RepID=UPI0030B8069E